MKCNSDFECGNGKDFAQVMPYRWQMKVQADRPGYDHFFMFRIESETETGTVEMQVLPDTAAKKPGYDRLEFRGSEPTLLWRKRGSDGPWERVERGAFEIVDGKVTIHQAVERGESWFWAEAPPLPYSDIARHIEDLPTHASHVTALKLGETPEGRPLLAARVTDPDVPIDEKGRVVILAGQHGAEFAGMFAAKGALDFLASRLPQAAALRRRYLVDVLPCANPDGNAHGRGCFNSEGRDQLVAFENAARDAEPATAEARLIWRHLGENVPDLILNFHAYPHPRPFGDPPFEGMYVPDPDLLGDRERSRHQHVLNHALFYLTDGGSQHRQPCPAPPGTLEENAAVAWNTLACLYQVQAEAGPHRNLLTGVQVLRAALESLELAQHEHEGL